MHYFYRLHLQEYLVNAREKLSKQTYTFQAGNW